MSDLFEQPDDAATPLMPEEIRDLLPAHIAYRHELNEAEQDNITRGQAWAFSRRRDLLKEKFIKGLHRQMFGDVWRWAGKFRTSERNIGIAHWQISVELRQLLDDTRAWFEYNTYPPDEIAVRFHHRLVPIHAFPNGNGRHARLMADLLVMQLGGERFSWGRESLRDPGTVRQRYIEALRAADHHDIGSGGVSQRAFDTLQKQEFISLHQPRAAALRQHRYHTETAMMFPVVVLIGHVIESAKTSMCAGLNFYQLRCNSCFFVLAPLLS